MKKLIDERNKLFYKYLNLSFWRFIKKSQLRKELASFDDSLLFIFKHTFIMKNSDPSIPLFKCGGKYEVSLIHLPRVGCKGRPVSMSCDVCTLISVSESQPRHYTFRVDGGNDPENGGTYFSVDERYDGCLSMFPPQKSWMIKEVKSEPIEDCTDKNLPALLEPPILVDMFLEDMALIVYYAYPGYSLVYEAYFENEKYIKVTFAICDEIGTKLGSIVMAIASDGRGQYKILSPSKFAVKVKGKFWISYSAIVINPIYPYILDMVEWIRRYRGMKAVDGGEIE